MFGKAGELFGKLQEMKKKADEVKARLSEHIILEEGAGGDIRVEMTADRKVRRIAISPALQHGNAAELCEQLEVTLNRALAKAEKVNEDEMRNAASGMLPGML